MSGVRLLVAAPILTQLVFVNFRYASKEQNADESLLAYSSARLERSPDTRDVEGSNPSRPTKWNRRIIGYYI